MKSFRVTRIQETLESWPAILGAVSLCVILAYFGWLNAACRITLIGFGALYFGYLLRGTLTSNLRAKYPHAKEIWLLSVGYTSAAFGVLVRMLMPALQGGWVDYVWLALSFTAFLIFVLLNRRDPDVLK